MQELYPQNTLNIMQITYSNWLETSRYSNAYFESFIPSSHYLGADHTVVMAPNLRWVLDKVHSQSDPLSIITALIRLPRDFLGIERSSKSWHYGEVARLQPHSVEILPPPPNSSPKDTPPSVTQAPLQAKPHVHHHPSRVAPNLLKYVMCLFPRLPDFCLSRAQAQSPTLIHREPDPLLVLPFPHHLPIQPHR